MEIYISFGLPSQKVGNQPLASTFPVMVDTIISKGINKTKQKTGVDLQSLQASS